MAPTQLDRALNSKWRHGPSGAPMSFLLKMIPKAVNPENWTADEMRRWLRARGLLPNENATREELLERVKANLRIPRTSKSAASQQ
ncbi:unnamed protein product [Penicillium pancosmium]